MVKLAIDLIKCSCGYSVDWTDTMTWAILISEYSGRKPNIGDLESDRQYAVPCPKCERYVLIDKDKVRQLNA